VVRVSGQGEGEGGEAARRDGRAPPLRRLVRVRVRVRVRVGVRG